MENELTTPGKRLEYLIKKVLKTSPNKFGKALEMSDTKMIYNYINGITALSEVNLAPMLELYPEFNPDYILSGKLPELKAPINDKQLRTNLKCQDCKKKDEKIEELTSKIKHLQEIYDNLRDLYDKQEKLLDRYDVKEHE